MMMIKTRLVKNSQMKGMIILMGMIRMMRKDGQNEDDHDFKDEEDVDGDQSVTYRYQEFIFLVVSEKFGTSKKSRNR